MEQAPGFVNPEFSNYVYLLKKSIYGVKQAPWALFDRLSQFFSHHRFICSKAHPSLFTFDSNDIIILILLYSRDIIVVGNNNHQFDIKYLGPLHYILVVSKMYFNGSALLH